MLKLHKYKVSHLGTFVKPFVMNLIKAFYHVLSKPVWASAHLLVLKVHLFINMNPPSMVVVLLLSCWDDVA